MLSVSGTMAFEDNKYYQAFQNSLHEYVLSEENARLKSELEELREKLQESKNDGTNSIIVKKNDYTWNQLKKLGVLGKREN